MEAVMNTDMRAPRRNNGRILAGIAVILAGLAMLADRMGFGDLHLSGRYWPLILVALGVLRLSDRTRPDGSARLGPLRRVAALCGRMGLGQRVPPVRIRLPEFMAAADHRCGSADGVARVREPGAPGPVRES